MPRRELSGLSLFTSLLAFAAEAWAHGNATATGAVLFEHGSWRCKTTRHGIMAYSRGREDLVSESLDMLGEYSESESRLFSVLLRPGDTVLDVGANMGAHSVALASFVGPAGRVHAFEPGAVTAAFLRANVALNALDERVLVHQVAVGDGSAPLLTLVTTDANYGTAYLTSDRHPPLPDPPLRGSEGPGGSPDRSCVVWCGVVGQTFPRVLFHFVVQSYMLFVLHIIYGTFVVHIHMLRRCASRCRKSRARAGGDARQL
jgi:hypothetical protein